MFTAMHKKIKGARDMAIRTAYRGGTPRDSTLATAGMTRARLDEIVECLKTERVYTRAEMNEREGTSSAQTGGILYRRGGSHITFVIGAKKYDDHVDAQSIEVEGAGDATTFDKGVNKHVRDLMNERHRPLTANVYRRVGRDIYVLVGGVGIRSAVVREFAGPRRTRAYFECRRLDVVHRPFPSGPEEYVWRKFISRGRRAPISLVRRVAAERGIAREEIAYDE